MARRVGVQDAWEHQGFDFVPFDPGTVITYLLRPDRRESWAPAAPALFYLALVRTHGQQTTDRAIDNLRHTITEEVTYRG